MTEAAAKTEEPPNAPVPPPKQKSGWIDWHQGNILADRYLETVLADWKNTGLLLVQAPILAGLAVMVWGNLGRANASLYFVMTLSAIWIGCMDSCREIVKERPLFLREKMAGLNVASYIYSKFRVLAVLSFVQAVTYSLIVFKWVDVNIAIGWLIIALIAATLCGCCLGLLISALVERTDYAVGLVPLVILPQILFSEFAIKADQFEGASEIVYKLMPSRWGYESLSKFASMTDDLTAFLYLFPLLIFGALFLALCYPILRVQRY